MISLLKMAEHELKEKDGFLRKLLMMRRNIFFPITFFVYVVLEELQYLNF